LTTKELIQAEIDSVPEEDLDRLYEWIRSFNLIRPKNELKDHINDAIQQVEEKGEIVEVTRQGQVVARLVPTHEQPLERDANGAWSTLLRLQDEISADWPEGVSAQDAINDVRSDL
jgi:antitoxin (DNA-binding transcriptional repressor) of toxin-antitoxin stability system